MFDYHLLILQQYFLSFVYDLHFLLTNNFQVQACFNANQNSQVSFDVQFSELNGVNLSIPHSLSSVFIFAAQVFDQLLRAVYSFHSLSHPYQIWQTFVKSFFQLFYHLHPQCFPEHLQQHLIAEVSSFVFSELFPC